MTPAQAERLELLRIYGEEIVDTINEIIDFGYDDIPPGETSTNGEYLNEMINHFLSIRSRMYDLGDMKSRIPNFNQIWRDIKAISKHQDEQ